jgi:hypothetical protein
MRNLLLVYDIVFNVDSDIVKSLLASKQSFIYNTAGTTFTPSYWILSQINFALIVIGQYTSIWVPYSIAFLI